MIISAAILAGGENSRMDGKNKALLEIEGETLLQRQIIILSDFFDDIFVVGKGIPRSYNVKHVSDIFPASGPLSGIHSALCFSQTDYVFVVSCDMPFLSPKLIELMISEIKKNPCEALVPRHNKGIEPLHSIYNRSIIEKAEIMLRQKEFRIRKIYKNINVNYFDVNLESEKIFFNINYPDDLKKAQSYIE